jgi:hypothetical protein
MARREYHTQQTENDPPVPVRSEISCRRRSKAV